MVEIDNRVVAVATLLKPDADSAIFLICDHASNNIPREFNDLGVDDVAKQSHICWDIGAAEVTRVISEQLNVTAVLATTSRLVIDCNRQADAVDIIADVSHDVAVPGNQNLDFRRRESRFQRFYHPYHQVVDRQLGSSNAVVVVSVHSFDQALDQTTRDFDIGILFDEGEALARLFAKHLGESDFRVRLNEPYSGRANVISSAQRHGRKYQLPNYELEINQRLLGSTEQAIEFGMRLAPAIAWLGQTAKQLRLDNSALN